MCLCLMGQAANVACGFCTVGCWVLISFGGASLQFELQLTGVLAQCTTRQAPAY